MARARALLRYSATRLGLAPVMLWLIATLVFLLFGLKKILEIQYLKLLKEKKLLQQQELVLLCVSLEVITYLALI